MGSLYLSQMDKVMFYTYMGSILVELGVHILTLFFMDAPTLYICEKQTSDDIVCIVGW